MGPKEPISDRPVRIVDLKQVSEDTLWEALRKVRADTSQWSESARESMVEQLEGELIERLGLSAWRFPGGKGGKR